MKWPFVSRETLDEVRSSRDRMIDRLEREILELKEDRKVTVDILSVRALGVPIYGKIQPPKEEVDEPEPEQQPVTEDGQPRPPMMGPGGGRARGIAQQVAARNMANYEKELEETSRLIELAKADGARAAEAVPANGNGNHS